MRPFGLAWRITIFIFLFAAEWVPLFLWGGPGPAGHFLFRSGIVCGGLFLALGYARARSSFDSISSELEDAPLGWGFLAGHVCALLAFLYFESIPSDGVLTPLRYLTGIFAIALAGFAFVPPKSVWRFIRQAGFAWAYALPVGLIAWAAMSAPPETSDRILNTLLLRVPTNLTFDAVRLLLWPFLHPMVADRATVTIGSPSFAVTIATGCIGWEGMALMLVFSTSWLFVRRRELRFPRALLLVPAGMGAMWISNAVRIATLVLIGVAGAPKVAMNGFHSEAGWIAFNCIALTFVIYTEKARWFSIQAARPSRPPFAESSTVAHLLPLLAILTAAMISRAASGGFEWLYPLRVAAAAAVLWFFRGKYKELDWKFGGLSLILGAAAAATWLALNVFAGLHPNDGLTPAIPPGPVGQVWLVCRILAALITVPIAEELAFRGFLISYLIPGKFELFHPMRYTCLAVAISSLVFGLLHGGHWVAGIIAGLLYSIAYLRHRRIGDAVVAHATTNALVAAAVLWSGNSSWW